MESSDIITFWFEEIAPRQWFVKDSDFDEQIRQRFSDVHQAATRCELSPWRETPEGRLAEVIILDQFSRNLYRDTAQAFASDSLALALAQEAVSNGHDKALTPHQKAFLYMPWMHSESAVIHHEAVALFSQPGLEDNYQFELRHKAIIDRFGRYPHRNALLGRQSTPEELEFLQQPGSSF
ncbi:membrane protein [Elysia marginata]|uniref:Membrane protein n=1 Tax=Elysia marginata TaxID=1093978 RepID=A0AAV4HG31_9GAST|nr:membrane protein [Elysia marginata]